MPPVAANTPSLKFSVARINPNRYAVSSENSVAKRMVRWTR